MAITDVPQLYRDASGVPIPAFAFPPEGTGFITAKNSGGGTVSLVGTMLKAIAAGQNIAINLDPGVYEFTILDAADHASGVPPNVGVVSFDDPFDSSKMADADSFVVPTSIYGSFLAHVDSARPWLSIYNKGASNIDIAIRRVL